MALELKGLKASMMKLQGRVDRLNSLAAAGDEKGAMLEGHLTDIGKQLGAHVDDIEFAANMLGNSGGRSEDSETGKERPAEKQVITVADVGKIAQEVGQAAQGTFHE